jgi:ABC-2 type transport system ATP-binding protein
MPVLQVKKLTKHFISRPWWKPANPPVVTKAVNGISFAVKEGEIVGLLGPNGAGKTTTVQMLLGALIPSAGEITYFGKKFDTDNKRVLGKVNFSSAYIDLPHRMTVWENLDVYARLYEVKNRNERINRLLEEFESTEFRNKQMNQLSAGQKTRILLAKAFINYPRVLLLDEPTASLDPDIAVKIRQFLVRQQKEYGVTMLFTSHNMHEVQEICDRIIFLNKGEIIAKDTPSDLVKKLKRTQIKLIVDAKKQTLEEYLSEKKISFIWQKNRITISIGESEIPKVLYRISEKGIRYSEIEILRPNLEDYFLEVVNKNRQEK